MKLAIRLPLVCLLGAFLGACGARKNIAVQFETTEPLRVMVLPFTRVDDEGNVLQEDANLLVDSVPLVSEELDEDPPELLRQMVQNELQGTALDVLSPFLVNIELPHHGYAKPDGSFDLQKIYSTKPQELCSHFLDCDAVLYGRVTDWDRSYFALQTVNSVGLELQLVSARTGKTLYQIEASDSEGRGVSGGPTGFSDLVLEPIKGLDSKIIEEVARRVARESVAPLKIESRPEFLENPPPSIYAVAHTPDTLKKENRLLILAFASPGNSARFSIGTYVTDFPMVEVEPGHYVGEYYPYDPGKRGETPVVMALIDGAGRRTEQISASGKLR